MTAYVALLRGVNLPGVSSLKMVDLKQIAGELGLKRARTYIASGNLLFVSAEPEEKLRRMLEKDLQAHMGRDVRVMLRTAAEMAEAVRRNPFTDSPGNRVQVFFMNDAPPAIGATLSVTRLRTNASALVRARSMSRTAKKVSASRESRFPPPNRGPRAT